MDTNERNEDTMNTAPNETVEENNEEKPESRKEEAQPEGKGKKTAKKKGFWHEVREWAVSLAVALLIVFVVRTFLFTIIRVDGDSMNNTLFNNERLFVTVTDVKLGNIDRNDVVICHYPDRWTTHVLGIKTKTYFVKRVVGVPGDVISREQGVTYVSYTDETGAAVKEALDPQSLGRFAQNDYEGYTLGEDEYFVVGDNRYNSHDSRDWNDTNSSMDVGPITQDMIVGHVRTVIWPLDSIRGVE